MKVKICYTEMLRTHLWTICMKCIFNLHFHKNIFAENKPSFAEKIHAFTKENFFRICIPLCFLLTYTTLDFE